MKERINFIVLNTNSVQNLILMNLARFKKISPYTFYSQKARNSMLNFGCNLMGCCIEELPFDVNINQYYLLWPSIAKSNPNIKNAIFLTFRQAVDYLESLDFS